MATVGMTTEGGELLTGMEYLQLLNENQRAIRDVIQFPLSCTCGRLSANDEDLDSSRTDNSSEIETSSFSKSQNTSICKSPLCANNNIIERMWEDFSVDHYSSNSSPLSTPRTNHSSSTAQSSPNSVTIPRPFSMTLREEHNKLRRKSRSMQLAERERLEREALEESELQKQFKANPVPVSTFLPLYEMIKACNEKRREEVKANSQRILKATEKPFTFVAREKEKQKLLEECKRQCEEELEKRMKKERQFKAKPIPKHVFNPTINDEMLEQEEYRKIRIRMRALESLAGSHLPWNMAEKNSHYTVGKFRKLKREKSDKEAFLTSDHTFQPQVNETVPDHREAFREFEKQLIERKESNKSCTAMEPFDLRIDKRMTLRKHRDLESTSRVEASDNLKHKSSSAIGISSTSCNYIPVTHSAQLYNQTTHFSRDDFCKLK